MGQLLNQGSHGCHHSVKRTHPGVDGRGGRTQEVPIFSAKHYNFSENMYQGDDTQMSTSDEIYFC